MLLLKPCFRAWLTWNTKVFLSLRFLCIVSRTKYLIYPTCTLIINLKSLIDFHFGNIISKRFCSASEICPFSKTIYTRFLFLFPWKLSAEIWTQKEARQNRSLISPRFLDMTKYDWISVSIQQSFPYTFNFKNRLEFFFSNCQTVLVSGRLVLQHYFRLPLWITSFPKTRNSRISWGTSMPLCSQTLLYWDKKWSRIFKF